MLRDKIPASAYNAGAVWDLCGTMSARAWERNVQLLARFGKLLVSTDCIAAIATSDDNRFDPIGRDRRRVAVASPSPYSAPAAVPKPWFHRVKSAPFIALLLV